MDCTEPVSIQLTALPIAPHFNPSGYTPQPKEGKFKPGLTDSRRHTHHGLRRQIRWGTPRPLCNLLELRPSFRTAFHCPLFNFLTLPHKKIQLRTRGSRLGNRFTAFLHYPRHPRFGLHNFALHDDLGRGRGRGNLQFLLRRQRFPDIGFPLQGSGRLFLFPNFLPPQLEQGWVQGRARIPSAPPSLLVLAQQPGLVQAGAEGHPVNHFPHNAKPPRRRANPDPGIWLGHFDFRLSVNGLHLYLQGLGGLFQNGTVHLKLGSSHGLPGEIQFLFDNRCTGRFPDYPIQGLANRSAKLSFAGWDIRGMGTIYHDQTPK